MSIQLVVKIETPVKLNLVNNENVDLIPELELADPEIHYL